MSAVPTRLVLNSAWSNFAKRYFFKNFRVSHYDRAILLIDSNDVFFLVSGLVIKNTVFFSVA